MQYMDKRDFQAYKSFSNRQSILCILVIKKKNTIRIVSQTITTYKIVGFSKCITCILSASRGYN